jgi:hypothetical protein
MTSSSCPKGEDHKWDVGYRRAAGSVQVQEAAAGFIWIYSGGRCPQGAVQLVMELYTVLFYDL